MKAIILSYLLKAKKYKNDWLLCDSSDPLKTIDLKILYVLPCCKAQAYHIWPQLVFALKRYTKTKIVYYQYAHLIDY